MVSLRVFLYWPVQRLFQIDKPIWLQFLTDVSIDIIQYFLYVIDWLIKLFLLHHNLFFSILPFSRRFLQQVYYFLALLLGSNHFAGIFRVVENVLLWLLRPIMLDLACSIFIFLLLVRIVIVLNQIVKTSIKTGNQILAIIEREANEEHAEPIAKFLTFVSNSIQFLIGIIHFDKQKKQIF